MILLRIGLILFTVTFLMAEAGPQDILQVGFWNVENLFDTTDAELKRDDDFTPSGKYEWTEERLQKKLQYLSRVISDIASDNDLALLGLSEIENFSVLNRLNVDFLKSGMKIIHKESPDERGIDCGLLYDPSKLTLVDQAFLTIYLAGEEKTRDIIEARFEMTGSRKSSPLYVFINHWPSRWGGQAQTDPLRRTTARTLRTRIDQILTKSPQADIIVLGDFNDYPSDPSLNEDLSAKAAGPHLYPGDMINTMFELHNDPSRGTVMYRGDWTVLDQIIISQGMRDTNGFDWVFGSTKTFMQNYLLESDGKFAGWPFRMYRGTQYQGGYSDHLPILCKLSFSNF